MRRSGKPNLATLEAEVVALRERVAELEHDTTAPQNGKSKFYSSESYNRMLFEQSPMGLALCRMDGSLVDANAAYAAITGYSIDELKQLSYWDITPESYASKEQTVIETLTATGRYGPYEKEYRHKDGRLIPVRLSGLIVEHAGQSYIWSSVEDITERVKIEEALRTSEERLQAILDNAPAVIYVKDIEGRYLLMNHRYESIFNLKREEVLGKTDHAIFPAEMAEAFQQVDRKVAESGAPLELEELAPHPDGIHTYLSVKFPLRSVDGKVTAVCGISTDITERKRAEGALHQSILQEETIRAQAAALAELSTPLLTISQRTVVMPLIGSIDSARAQQVMDTLLHGVSEQRAEVAIIDITGIPVVDTQVANAFVRAAQAVQLLGAQVVLTGIRPEVAQTLIGLGVDLRGIVTRSSLQSGIAYAMK